jgi:hypothetical protein
VESQFRGFGADSHRSSKGGHVASHERINWLINWVPESPLPTVPLQSLILVRYVLYMSSKFSSFMQSLMQRDRGSTNFVSVGPLSKEATSYKTPHSDGSYVNEH